MIAMKAISRLIRFLAAVALSASLAPAFAAGGDYPLDRFPTSKMNDVAALQRGAQLYTNYCMGCHSMGSMRFNRMRDLGLTDDQIKENLVFTGGKVGDLMTIPMSKADAKEWLAAAPPDLSVTARSRSSGAGSGSDWIYTFLRSYYRDGNRPTGWNNALYPDVGMPHVLWSLQGVRGADVHDVHPDPEAPPVTGHGAGDMIKTTTTYDTLGFAKVANEKLPAELHAHAGKSFQFGPTTGGDMTTIGYDDAVADLVAFMTYVADPSAKTRKRLGIWVLLFLSLFFGAAWMLNSAFWKDIK